MAAANPALLGDKQFLLNEKHQAFIMWGVIGRTWVAMGDPVGPCEQWPELLWQFRQAADRYADRAVFYEVGHEHLHLYLDMGLALLKLGEEARVALTGFTIEGGGRKNLRYIHRKLAKQGCTFEFVPAVSVPAHMNALKTISEAWLREKNTREKGFSLGSFNPAYVRRFPIALVWVQNQIVAFANLWFSAGRQEFTVDLMRYLPDAPDSVMDFLFIELMLWANAQGFRWFNLGIAPLSGLGTHELAPLCTVSAIWWSASAIISMVFRGCAPTRTNSIRSGSPSTWPRREGCPYRAPWLISGGFKGILFKLTRDKITYFSRNRESIRR